VPKPFNLLAEFANFGAERRLSLRDEELKEAFGLHVSSSVEQALADDILLHGQRAEAMFEALVVALGEHKLIKSEDGGRFHSTENFRVPDFRVVLRDGEQWLVEVKNVYEEDPFAQRRLLMKRDYREALEAYAAATGAKLKLAVFWARWSVWTLVSPERFIDPSGNLLLGMNAAMIGNELGRLGDRTIGTRAPLRLRFTSDPARTSTIDEDGQVTVTFGGWQLLSGEDVVTEPVEKEIAFIFMEHGEWRCDGPLAIVEGNRLEAVEFRWEPEEPTDQGFEFVGSLSRMFARYFASETLKDKSVVQLRAPLRPAWFAPLIQTDPVSDALPLWRFLMQPRYPSPAPV
jgi:hypothetical protein